MRMSAESGIIVSEEQQKIIDLAESQKNISISAYAGSGKTTTLKLIVDKLRKKDFLYLVFNKSMKDEAIAKFRGYKNIKIDTTHSYAYNHLKYKMNIKNFEDLKTYKIKEMFDVDFYKARHILNLFKTYLQSDAIEIDESLVFLMTKQPRILNSLFYSSEYNLIVSSIVNYPNNMTLSEKVANYIMYRYPDIIDYAHKLFNAMYKGDLHMLHDFYLKVFYLELIYDKIKLRSYDYVLLDEAQDTNPLVYAIFVNLFKDQAVKIAVGDPYQNIYEFRGSINILNDLVQYYNFVPASLSVSYRFSNDIANSVNKMIFKYLDETINLKGNNLDNMKPVEKNAYISRTNAYLMRYIDSLDSFYLTRNINEIMELPINIVYFMNRNLGDITEKYSFLKSFNDIYDLEESASQLNDIEMLSAISMAKQFRGKIFDLIKKYNQVCSKDAKIVLTTAHSCKGLEFDEIYLLDNFPDLNELKNNNNSLDNSYRQEVNLYYVAATRAKYKIYDNTPNKDFKMSEDTYQTDNIKDTIL